MKNNFRKCLLRTKCLNRGFYGSYFHIFGLNTEIYLMNLFKYRKIRIRKKICTWIVFLQYVKQQNSIRNLEEEKK